MDDSDTTKTEGSAAGLEAYNGVAVLLYGECPNSDGDKLRGYLKSREDWLTMAQTNIF